MPAYRVRVATPADVDALVHHRIGMFSDMGVAMDDGALATAFRRWVEEALESGVYRAWVVEDLESGEKSTVGGGGITVLPWPPGPRFLSDRLAFVYNVYVDPAHRRRGLARRIMETIHAWCRSAGISSIALNSSDSGRALYE